MLFYLTFFLAILIFDTQKWLNNEMGIVSGTELGSIKWEWLNGGSSAKPRQLYDCELRKFWLRKFEFKRNCEKLFSINVRDSLKIYNVAAGIKYQENVYER